MPVLVLPRPTDADLLAAAARRDRAALGELVRRYVDFVYASAVRQLADRSAAEDVTQAVFLTLARKAARVRPPTLSAWLHQTTRYAAANARRSARRRTRHEHAAAKPEATMPQDLAPEIAAGLDLLDDAVARLPTKERIAVIERYFNGRDVAQVAASLNTTPAAAQKRIERAVERLRGTLTGEYVRRARAGRNVRMNVGLPATAAVVGVLAAAAPTAATAAPPTLAASVTAAVATPAAASAGALAVANGVKQTLFWTNAKAVAMFAAGALVAAVAGVAVVHELGRRTPAVVSQPSTPLSSTVASAPTLTMMNRVAIAKLASGVSIEYLGVSENPSEGRPWYGPDGQRLADRPYPLSPSTLGVDPQTVTREYAFATDAGMQSDGLFVRSGVATVRPFAPDPRNAGRLLIERPTHDDGSIVGGRIAATVETPLADKTTKVPFLVAAGRWVPRVVSLPDADTTIIGENDVARVVLGRPFGDEEDGFATAWYWPAAFYSWPDVRFVAIDSAGNVHEPQARPWDYRSPAQRSAEPELDRMMPRQRFRNTPLGDVVRFIADQGVMIVMDWDSLAKRKVTPESPVNANLDADRLYHWMSRLLLNVDHTAGDPAFDVVNGEVRVHAANYQRPRPVAYFVPSVTPERLARFEVQTRPFDEWVRFSGLTTELGRPSDVRIETSDGRPAANLAAAAGPATKPTAGAVRALPDGTTVELVALGDAATGECWTPDGTPTPVPFGIEPEKPDPAWAAKSQRVVWAVTVARRPDGSEPQNDPRPTRETGDTFITSGPDSSRPVQYRLIQFFVDPSRPTVDLSVGVATRPPKTASIQRGFDGWDPKAVAGVDVAGGRMWVWGPTTNAAGEATFSAWVPPYGPGEASYLAGVRYDGSPLANTMWITSPVPQVRTIRTHDTLDGVYRVTVGMTTYDQTATFAGVPLRPAGR